MADKKILVYLDGSALAESALPHAQMQASDEDAEMILPRVSRNPSAGFSLFDPSLANSLIQETDFSLLYIPSLCLLEG